MNRQFFALLALVVVATAVAPIGAVAAQQSTTTTENATTTQNTTTIAPAEDNNVSTQLTDTLTLRSWTVEDGTFRLTFHADIPASITITDSGALMEALAEDSGSRTEDIPYESYTLTSGRTTVQFDATVVDGAAAITIGSSESLKMIRTDSMSAGDKPAVPWSKVQLLLLCTVGLTAGGTFRVVRKKANSEEKEAERIL